MNIRFTRRRLLGAAGTAIVGVLVFGSVQTTGATWFGKSTVNGGTITAGTLSLSPGSGSSPSFTFPALNGTNVVPGQQVQASLLVANTGSSKLTYKLNSAGPNNSGVNVDLAGWFGACGTGTAVFTVTGATSTTTTATSTTRPLAVGANETLCIRATLNSVSGAGQQTYNIVFNFGATQVFP